MHIDVRVKGRAEPRATERSGVSMASTERSDPLTRRRRGIIDGDRHGGGGHGKQSSFCRSLLGLWNRGRGSGWEDSADNSAKEVAIKQNDPFSLTPFPLKQNDPFSCSFLSGNLNDQVGDQ